MSAGKFVAKGRRRLAMISLVINLIGTGIVELEFIEAQLVGRVI